MNLLAEVTDWFGKYGMYILLGVVLVVFVVMMVLSNKKRKKQEQEIIDRNNAIKPGNKVKTIGGICGIVVEVDKEENTFVLETGSLGAGKSYIKFDMLAIYQTDAVPEPKTETPAETPAKEAEETPADPAEDAQSEGDNPADNG